MAFAPAWLVYSQTIPMAYLWILQLTLGECLWSPRQSAWAATVAPPGREGVFVAVGSIKDSYLGLIDDAD